MTSPTTPSLPDALRACIELGDKATPGDWTLDEDLPRSGTDWDDAGGFRINADGVSQLSYVWNKSRRLPVDGSQAEGPEFGSPSGEADARFIIATRNLIRQHGPALEALLREREWLLTSLTRIADDYHPDRPSENGQAIAEMREALQSLIAGTKP